MLYIPKIFDYLKILTDEEVKDFAAINFSVYYKSTRKNCILNKCILSEKQNLRKTAELLYIFLTIPNQVEKYAEIMQSNSYCNCVHCYNIEILNLFDPELQLINTKPMVKNKLKELLSELKKFKVQATLVLEYKKRSDCKIFHSSTKLIASNSDIDESFISMHQSIITKIKNYASEGWIDLDVTIKHSIKIFVC